MRRHRKKLEHSHPHLNVSGLGWRPTTFYLNITVETMVNRPKRPFSLVNPPNGMPSSSQLLISLPHFPTDLFHTFLHCKTLCCRFLTLVFRGIPLMDCGKKHNPKGVSGFMGPISNGNSTEIIMICHDDRPVDLEVSDVQTNPNIGQYNPQHQPIGLDRSHWPLLISWSCLGVWRRLKMFVDSPLRRLWKIEWNWKSTNNINLEKKSGTLHFPNIFLQPSNCPCADLCPCRRDGLLWGSAVMGNSCPRGRFLCWRYMLHVASYIGNVY